MQAKSGIHQKFNLVNSKKLDDAESALRIALDLLWILVRLNSVTKRTRFGNDSVCIVKFGENPSTWRSFYQNRMLWLKISLRFWEANTILEIEDLDFRHLTTCDEQCEEDISGSRALDCGCLNFRPLQKILKRRISAERFLFWFLLINSETISSKNSDRSQAFHDFQLTCYELNKKVFFF